MLIAARLIAIIFMAASLAVYASSPAPLDTKASVLTDTTAVQRGEISFARTCAMCHGHAGTGGIGKPLAKRKLSPDRIFNTITNGLRRGASFMPTFDKKLSLETRWELVAYLLSLRQTDPL